MIIANKAQLLIEITLSVPEGWAKKFGGKLSEDIWSIIKEKDLVGKYNLLQVKEKFGMLRWYGRPAVPEIEDIIKKYTHISKYTCYSCGDSAQWVLTNPWIIPICECCKNTKAKKDEAKLSIDYWKNWDELTKGE